MASKRTEKTVRCVGMLAFRLGLHSSIVAWGCINPELRKHWGIQLRWNTLSNATEWHGLCWKYKFKKTNKQKGQLVSYENTTCKEMGENRPKPHTSLAHGGFLRRSPLATASTVSTVVWDAHGEVPPVMTSLKFRDCCVFVKKALKLRFCCLHPNYFIIFFFLKTEGIHVLSDHSSKLAPCHYCPWPNIWCCTEYFFLNRLKRHPKNMTAWMQAVDELVIAVLHSVRINWLNTTFNWQGKI